MESLTSPPYRSRSMLAVCAALILVSSCISFLAARSKSPTFDEPLHLLGGVVHAARSDYRVNPEDPSLFGDLAALPVASRFIRLDDQSPAWKGMLAQHNAFQTHFTVQTLFQTRGNDGDQVVQRSRVIFVAIGICAAVCIAWWSWQLAGSVAAAFAVGLFALDPNFLAHIPLVKNDVSNSLLLAGTAALTWRFGRHGTVSSFLGISVLCALAMNIKFSGVLFGFIVALLLLIRAILPTTWRVFSFSLDQRWKRLVVIPVVCVIAGTTSCVAIWGVYGFRFAPTPDGQLLNTDSALFYIRAGKVIARLHRNTDIPPALIANEPAGVVAAAERFAERHRLLPQAWLYGFLYTYSTTIARSTFLMNQLDRTGVWYYFPCAFLFKTPTATLVMIPVAMAASVSVLLKRRRQAAFNWVPQSDEDQPPGVSKLIDWWTIACLFVPPTIYLLSAMMAGMNIGLRHILPVYPFLFIAMGVCAAFSFNTWGRGATIVAATLVAGLGFESLASFPDFIPFFNAPSRIVGRVNLLGDSNLDWGQDLKQLAEWQKSHRKKLYLCYFGLPDPAFYGVDAIHTPGGWFARKDEQIPAAGEHCYLAISATNLQGIYHNEENRALYRPLKSAKPVAILGESIYIYELPL